MKKLLLSILCSTCFFLSCTASIPVQATSPVHDSHIISDYIEPLEDGSYFRITISETGSSSVSRSVQTLNGTKNITFYDSDGTAAWQFTLNGTFRFEPGVSSSCSSSSYSISIYDSSWENTSASSSASGNQATGDAVFVKRALFLPIQTENVFVTLSCDPYGNLS